MDIALEHVPWFTYVEAEPSDLSSQLFKPRLVTQSLSAALQLTSRPQVMEFREKLSSLEFPLSELMIQMTRVGVEELE